MSELDFPKIFVIVLNFNGKDTLNDCLSSVFKSEYPNFEMVIVDNDSKDGSFEQAKLNFSRCHFIKNSKNTGFSSGNNLGIRFALEKFADYVFLLNNDAVIEKDTLSLLMATTKKYPAAGVVSPVILTGNKKDIWFAGGKIEWNKMKTTHLTANVSSQPYTSEYLSGCAMLIKKEVFKKIGLFDERFFLYYEDADFSLRAKNAGFDLLISPTVRIQHFEQSSSNPSKTYWLVLSGLLFFKTHASRTLKVWFFIYVLLRKIKNFYNLHFTQDSCASEVHRAYVDFKKLPN